MIDFPSNTAVRRKLPKEAFYKHLPLTPTLKGKFVSDVESVFLENSLTMESLNLGAESEVKEILLLRISLKKPDFDAKIIEEIARQNSHELIFLLAHEDRRQLAVYYGKLYRTQWMTEDSVTLTPQGFTLDEVWDSLIEQIALQEERVTPSGDTPIGERLALQDKILKLEQQIARTEAAAWKERQPKKRFALYAQLQDYKRNLETMKHGQTQNADA